MVHSQQKIVEIIFRNVQTFLIGGIIYLFIFEGILDKETILDSLHHQQHTIYDRIDNEDKKIERIQGRRYQVVSFAADVQSNLLVFTCLKSTMRTPEQSVKPV